MNTEADTADRYAAWTSYGVAGVLDATDRCWGFVRQHVNAMLESLCQHHHAGNAVAMGRHLGRGKSTSWHWVNGASRPRHEALQKISFAYQVPLVDLLLGSIEAISSSLPRPLPTREMARGSYVRSINPWGLPMVKKLILDATLNPRLHGIFSFAELEKRTGISVRILRSSFPDELALLRVSIDTLRKIDAADAAKKREATVHNAIINVLASLPAGTYPSRRLVAKTIAKRFFRLTHREENSIPTFIKQLLETGRTVF